MFDMKPTRTELGGPWLGGTFRLVRFPQARFGPTVIVLFERPGLYLDNEDLPAGRGLGCTRVDGKYRDESLRLAVYWCRGDHARKEPRAGRTRPTTAVGAPRPAQYRGHHAPGAGS